MRATVLNGVAETLTGEKRRITGAVTEAEADHMASLIRSSHSRTTLETGVAFGISTLAICEALRLSGLPGVVHYGIDPCQITEHGGAALRLLERHGLEGIFRLFEGPTHLMAPRLLEEGTRVDFAFIDGFHTFDYTLLDVFYVDKLLRVGGYMAIHDLTLPSKKKVLRFLLGHRRYRLLKPGAPPIPLWTRLVDVLKAIKNRDPYWLWWPLFGTGNLAVLEKLEDWEPEWRFFKNF